MALLLLAAWLAAVPSLALGRTVRGHPPGGLGADGARTGLAALVLVATFGAFRSRVRATVSRTQELETLVAARSAELLESGRAMRTLLANLPGLAYRCQDDAFYTMEFVSDGCLALTGYPPEALVGNAEVAFVDLIEPEDLAQVRDEVERALAERRAYQITYRLVTRERQRRWVWEKGEAVRDGSGAVVALEGFITDVTERHVAEERLRKLYRAVEQSPSTIVITALDGTIELVNPAFTRTTGYTAEEAIGQNPRVLKSGKLPAAVYEDLWQTITRGDVWEGELLNKRRDGSLYWEHAVISPVRDASGRVTHYAAVKEDITQRRRAEEALKLEEQRLRSLYELSHREFASEEELGRAAIAEAARLTEARLACLFLVEPELRLLATSGTAPASTLGCAPGRSETASRTAARLGRPVLGDDHSLSCAAADVCAAGHVVAVPVLDRDQAVAVCCVCRTGEGFEERDAFQLQAYVDGVYRILLRRRVEAALRKRTEQLEALRQVGLSLMAELEPDRLLQSIARWAADLLEATSGEVRLGPSGGGARPGSVPPEAGSVIGVPIRWRDEELGVLDVCSDRPRRFSQEDARLLELFALQAAVAIKNASLFAQVTRDAQEKEALLGKEQEARAAAVAASRAKGVFLASMSHELRTPLNAILGFSQLMSRDPTLAPVHRENMETISRSGEHLLALINDVLDLSKIEAGRMEIVARDFDLFRVLDDLCDLFRQRAESKGLSLTLERAPDVPRLVRADLTRLRQVLINLVGNALKFTGEGGVWVRVSTALEPFGSRAPALRFEVEDSGIGIPASDVETVFEPFVQASGGRATGEGTGLGLSISRHWVRLMGGELTLESEGVLGKGARFVFTVPVGVAPQAPPATPAGGLEKPAASLRAMPRAWRAALARAAREGDVAEMARRLAALRAHDEALAGRLETLADDFAYDEILGLVEATEPAAREDP